MARKHKIQQALTRLVQAIVRFAQKLTSRNTYRFLRTAFVASRRRLQAGFVLPTTTLLIIVMMLVVSTLMFRSYQRSTDVISEYQRQEVQNAAAPAIERAKAKLEQLFNANLVAGIPPEALLEETLLSDDYRWDGEIELKPGGQNAPAWSFEVNDITVAYMILLRTSRGDDVTMDPDKAGALTSDEAKADKLLVRNGPLISGRKDNPACQRVDPDAADAAEGQVLGEGWFSTGPSSSLQKNFQVFAVAIPNGSSNSAISTLQYQQDRYIDRGNKWGAWFRTDLELYPGPRFTWNGAMHTQGSFFVKANAKNGFQSFLISSKNSCFYEPGLNSDITTAQHLVYSIPSLPSANASFTGPVEFDLHGTEGATPKEAAFADLNKDTPDSVTGDLQNSINIALNPERILTGVTGDESLPETRTAEGTDWNADPAWGAEDRGLHNRITIKSPACPPYVDDTYRADNRYGPKSSYNQAIRNPDDPTNCSVPVEGDFKYGEPISGNDQLTRNTPPVDQPQAYGLDGYWERRAQHKGLRVIVGQRLELGNPFGWGQAGEDPLNPNPNFPSHEQRQRRTLRDNLAAVQSTAVYFHKKHNGDLPVAFVATTVHPGTQKTLKESATFETISFAKKTGTDFNGLTTPIIATDFFNGRGTNGMEFTGLADTFTTNTALQKALSNLANFAGDPDGAFPPKQAGRVHPSPALTMWGNYSNLRRIVNTPYAQLSLADQTTIQTAAGTLGMLAYNIHYLQAYDYGNTTNTTNRTQGLDGVTGANAAGLNALADELWQLLDSGTLTLDDPPEAYIAKLEENGVNPQIIKLARFVMTKEQVERDRQNGFTDSNPNISTVGTVNVACNLSAPTPTIYGNNYFGLGAAPTATTIAGTTITQEQYVVGLSRLCSNEPKFPSLYYLFPSVNHNHDGSVGGPLQPATGPNAEPYFAYNNVANYNPDYTLLTEAEIGKIALQPNKGLTSTTWELPISAPSRPLTPAAPNASDQELITVDGVPLQVAFKDSALYDGREAMNVRTLNMDLNMLRTTTPRTVTENWLPATGIIYAFREDAVREDAIARPAGATVPAGEAAGTVMRANGASPTDPPFVAGMSIKSVDYYPDPDRRPYGFRLKNGSTVRRELTPNSPIGMTFVSDNPVYIQGHFNLHNTAANGSGNNIQEFTQRIGEAPNFTPTRQQFYNRTTLNPLFANPEKDWWRPTEVIADAVTILSNNFCDGSIEDGIIYAGVSDPKNNGQLSKADRQSKYGCNQGSDYTSYINQNRPLSPGFHGPWMSENRFDPPTQQNTAINSANSPIRIAPSGNPVYCNGTGAACKDPTNWKVYGVAPNQVTYLSFTTKPDGGKRHINADNTTVNMIMVSGVVPPRLNQINGGFHNFPRLLENWDNPRRNLFIQGSLIQLNFSNYATGPFSQYAWEPTTATDAGKNPYNYYQPPNRNWGYDVGLQYAPAGPVSERMIVPNAKRDEFYREPKADDPYICKLRKEIGFPCNP